MPPILLPTPEHLEQAAAIIKAGGLVAFPTETVYGLGANALDAQAAARIFEAKGRPRFDPLIVHIAELSMLSELAEVSPLAERLIERFWPGPLTLVLPKRPLVPSLVTSGLPTVAVRFPKHPVAQELIRRAGLPIAAPSANPFGYLSPTRAEHVARGLGDRVDMILDGGSTEFGLESTIVLLEEPPVLLRKGAIPLEALREVIGKISLEAPPTPLAPGSLPQHYAPHTLIRIVPPSSIPLTERSQLGLLAFQTPIPGFAASRILSPSGDLKEAAAHLFEFLHELDALQLRGIVAEPVPEVGLGAAIMDRLRRASNPR
jgi:L-threonylcarbamoyladenylate synthase